MAAAVHKSGRRARGAGLTEIEVIIGLLAVVVALATLARRIGVPYPILLVLGGLALGFVPGLPAVELDPELALVLFLPPLLYISAIFTSYLLFRESLRGIVLLAVGLPLATTFAVAGVAYLLIDQMTLAAAFVLGAIVSPPDAVAATSIIRRVGVPRRVTTIVEGESLLNDATGLVAYRIAVAAAVSGSFSVVEAASQFVLGAAGGIAAGVAVGFIVAWVRRHMAEDPPVANTISLLTPYVAYLAAEQLHVSGVLAVVAAGLFLGWRGPTIVPSRTRLQGYAFWEVVTFLLNGLVFVLIGLQLRMILDGLSGEGTLELVGYAAAVTATTVGVRLVWVLAAIYLPRRLSPGMRRRNPAPSIGKVLVIVWAGMRGVVSLAAALAIPLVTATGAPFPERDLILFLTFAVILFTLVGQGLTLPAVIRRLGVREDDIEAREELQGRVDIAQAALDRLNQLSTEDWVRDETAERVRGMYNYRRNRFVSQVDGDGAFEDRATDYQRLLRELLAAQRRQIVALRNSGEISDDVLHRIERDIDLEEARLES